MPELRVTGGRLRGRRVTIPAGDIRPTSERARQAFFNIVASELAGAHFLDLFAGSGIFSFEALSRGAARAVAVEQASRAAAAIAATARKLDAEVEVIRGDVLTALSRLGEEGQRFNVVYADPPYAFGEYPRLLKLLADGDVVAPAATVAIERRKGTTPFELADSGVLTFRKAVRYSDVEIAIFDRP